MENFLFDLIASQSNTDGLFHGGGKYAKKVFSGLLSYATEREWVVYGIYDSSKSLDNEIGKWINDNNIILIDIKKKSLVEITKEFSIGRFYTALPFGMIPYGIHDLLNSPCEVYLTIHGLRTLETAFPMDALIYITNYKEKIKMFLKIIFEKRLFMRDCQRYLSMMDRANVVTVSNHSKYSIMSFFPKIGNNIKVFYSPDVTEFEDYNTDENISDFSSSAYFLMVSGNRWLKNNIRSALALDQLFSERSDIKQNVIITGVDNPEIFLSRIKNKHRFTFYKYVSEALLKKLYENAYALIYMTLNEGFGYPPLEAMKLGTPVITCPFTSTTEICGDAVLYSNPYSIKEIKARILWILNDESKYDQLCDKSVFQYSVINELQKKDFNGLINYMLDKNQN